MDVIKGIYSQRCWIDGSLQEATVYFNGGLITGITKGAVRNSEGILDAGTDIVMPGVIDAHVHVNEPGRTDWEGFDSATCAAAAGGVTTIVDMPLNARPVTTTLPALRKKLEATEGKMHVHCGFYGGLVPGNENDVEAMIGSGVLGIKAFLTHSGIEDFPNVGEAELNAIMPLLARYHLPLLVHCELDDGWKNPEFISRPLSYSAYSESRPKDWENRAVRMMIRLCQIHHCPTHIVHVSSSDILEDIRFAREKGLPLSAETCPHYL